MRRDNDGHLGIGARIFHERLGNGISCLMDAKYVFPRTQPMFLWFRKVSASYEIVSRIDLSYETFGKLLAMEA